MNDAYASRKQRTNVGHEYPLAMFVVGHEDGRVTYYVKNLETGVSGLAATTKACAHSNYYWATKSRRAA